MSDSVTILELDWTAGPVDMVMSWLCVWMGPGTTGCHKKDGLIVSKNDLPVDIGLPS